MSEQIKQTIITLQDELKKQLEEAQETKRLINKLAVRAGMQPIYSDADLAAQDGVPLALQSDQFYGQPLAGSMRIILEMRRAQKQGPASVNEIYDGLVQGGFKFDTSNEENRKRNLRISLGKNTAQFHKLPNGLFGLTEWYPNVKAKRQTADEMIDELSKPEEPTK